MRGAEIGDQSNRLHERAVDAAWIQGHCPEVREDAAAVPAPSESLIQQIRRLPAEQRNQLLAAEAEKAAADYERDPEVRDWLGFDEPVRSEEDAGV